jgi:ADP-heptose:LPS heptosyltransferase
MVLLNSLLEWLAFLLLWPWLLRLRWRRQPVEKWILIVEPFGLGDALSLSIILDTLRRELPDHHVALLLKTENETLYAGDPRVSLVVTAPFPWSRLSGRKQGSWRDWRVVWRATAQLRALQPQFGLDTRSEIRSHILMVLCGCRERVGFLNYLNTNLNSRGLLLTRCVSKPPVMHRYDMNRRLVEEGLGVQCGPLTFPTFGFSNPRTMDATSLVLLHPGARWKFKQWPLEHWVTLVVTLRQAANVELRLIGMDTEGPLLQELAGKCRPPPPIVLTSLGDMAALLRQAALLICLDSGPMHMAVTLGTPVLALFGPGDVELWRPPGHRDRYLHVRYPCNPCLQKICIHPEDSCMTKISPDAVLQEALAMLRASPPAAVAARQTPSPA